MSLITKTYIIEPTWVKIPEVFGALDVINEPSVKQSQTLCTVTVIRCLGSLAVMTLTQIVRYWGSIPYWSTQFFVIDNSHLFNPLLHLVVQC